MFTFADAETSQVTAVAFKDGNVYLTMANGVTVGNPLHWFKWLESATPEQRDNLEMAFATVYFPDLDEGLDADEMLKGKSTSARTVPLLASTEHAGD